MPICKLQLSESGFSGVFFATSCVSMRRIQHGGKADAACQVGKVGVLSRATQRIASANFACRGNFQGWFSAILLYKANIFVVTKRKGKGPFGYTKHQGSFRSTRSRTGTNGLCISTLHLDNL